MLINNAMMPTYRCDDKLISAVGLRIYNFSVRRGDTLFSKFFKFFIFFLTK